jgi:hypothetical protein
MSLPNARTHPLVPTVSKRGRTNALPLSSKDLRESRSEPMDTYDARSASFVKGSPNFVIFAYGFTHTQTHARTHARTRTHTSAAAAYVSHSDR